MNVMKHKFLIIAFVNLFIVMALCACDKDDNGYEEAPTSVLRNNTIIAIVAYGDLFNDKVSIVKATIDSADTEVDIASAPYSDGGFTLKLPETLSDSYLEEIEYHSLDGITISDPKVKTATVYELDAYMSDDNVGYFYFASSTNLVCQHTYSNGDVSITGVGTEEYKDDERYKNTYKYNVHLKKGWNRIYVNKTETANYEYEYEIITKAPSMRPKWYFHDCELHATQSFVSQKVSSRLSKRRSF
jgi:hypothetical protein